MRTLIICHQTVVSPFYQSIFIKVHIRIADDTFQFLNCVIDFENNLNIIRLFCKLTYSFVAIYFFSKCKFTCLYLKRAHKFKANIFIDLNKLWQRKEDYF